MQKILIRMQNKVKKELQKLANPEKAKLLSGFFKTGKGQYGEGDIFLGITVPAQREVAKRNLGIGFSEISDLLKSKIHEHRLVGLLILVENFRKMDDAGKKKIFEFYMKNTKAINNWDLVDLSSSRILGEYLLKKERKRREERKILYRLAKSKNLWEKRISIISTLAFIREKEFDDALAISEILLHDKHDLIHKAVGWALREIGKKDQETEEKFLRKYYKTMPRTMLRYSIERFDEKKRKFYMGK